MTAPLRAGLVVLALALALSLAPPAAWAEDAGPTPGAPPAAEGPAAGAEQPAGNPAEDAAQGKDAALVQARMSPEALDAWLRVSPLAWWSTLLLKYGVALLGAVLLVRLWRRREKERIGLLPPPPPAPEPTLVLPPIQALFLFLGVYMLGMIALQGAMHARPSLADSIVFQMGGLQAVLLPLSLFVLHARRRARAQTAVGPARILPRALWVFAAATAIVVPTLPVSLMICDALGLPIDLYGPVEKVVEGAGTEIPWVIAFFAVVVAPFNEEAVFRGLLYPAARHALGNGRRGAILGALVVSGFFALAHSHYLNFLPLLTLALVLTWVFERTNSLATVMGAHALWNLSSMLPLLLRVGA